MKVCPKTVGKRARFHVKWIEIAAVLHIQNGNLCKAFIIFVEFATYYNDNCNSTKHYTRNQEWNIFTSESSSLTELSAQWGCIAEDSRTTTVSAGLKDRDQDYETKSCWMTILFC